MDRLVSPNGKYELKLQNDGNFVVYRIVDGRVIWAGNADPEPLPDEPVPFPPTNPERRSGRVRLDGRAMADDGGQYCALGASLFWAVRGAKSEPERLTQNLRWLKNRGVDFVRVFADTTDWTEDRRTDPRWPDYEMFVRRCLDIAESEQLRIAWTLFGGNQLTPAQQWSTADVILRLSQERPHLVQYVEVANENQGNLSAYDYGAYVRMFSDAGFVVVTTSLGHMSSAIKAINASASTVHFDRTMGENGWRPVRQPWGYPGEYGEHLPATFINGEPIGPGSSVASDADPERLAMGAVHTWLLGGCAHVVHFGAGIYGVQTSHPVGGNRPPNVWEQEALADTLTRIAQFRTALPPDLPNWTRTRHGLADHPFVFPFDGETQKFTTVGDVALETRQGCVRAYAAHKDGRYICAVIGVMGGCTLTPQRTDTSFSLRESEGRSYLITGNYR